MTELEIVAQWRRVTAELSPETAADTGEPREWKTEPVGHFLHAFRPDGDRLPELFAGMPGLEPVLERLRTVFHRAGPETGHMYFVVSRPRSLDDAEVIRLVRGWLASVRAMLEALELEADDDVRDFLRRDAPRVEVVHRAPPSRDPGDAHPVQETVYEAVTELGRSWSFRSPAGDLLIEPLYMLACSYELAYWVLTPLAREAAGEPFAPAAALWEAGVELEFVGSGAKIAAKAYRGPAATPL